MSTVQDKVAALEKDGIKSTSFPVRAPGAAGTGGTPSEQSRSIPLVSLG